MANVFPQETFVQLAHTLVDKPVFRILRAQTAECGILNTLNAYVLKIHSGMVKPASHAVVDKSTWEDLDAAALLVHISMEINASVFPVINVNQSLTPNGTALNALA